MKTFGGLFLSKAAGLAPPLAAGESLNVHFQNGERAWRAPRSKSAFFVVALAFLLIEQVVFQAVFPVVIVGYGW